MTALVVQGDAARLPLPDNSVDLIVTSPPYWKLRSYTDRGTHYRGQLGSEPTWQGWLTALVGVTREFVRVLKPTGSIFVDLSDKYLPNKSLALLPERYRIACVDDLGLIARKVIIWHKTNPIPDSAKDRTRSSHEDWVHLTLQPRYYSAVDEIREAQQSTGERHVGRSGWVGAPNGIARSFTERSLNPLGKLPGSVWSIPSEPLQVPPGLGVDHFAAFPTEWPRRLILGWSPPGICIGCGQGRRPVVDASYVRRQQNFPGRTERNFDNNRSDVALPFGSSALRLNTITGYACACTPYTDHPTTPAIILDPFGGTGTTALVAHALGRVGISVDMSGDYSRLAAWRTTDRGELARALRVAKPAKPISGQLDMFEVGA